MILHMYPLIFLFFFSVSLAASSTEEFVSKYEQEILDDLLVYQTKVQFDNPYYAAQLLDVAKQHRHDGETYYQYATHAFEENRKLQYGMFSIFTQEEKRIYLQENKKYLAELFRATRTEENIKNTFNIWLNYKRTLFDDENGFQQFEANPTILATQSLLNKKREALAKANQKQRNQVEIVRLEQDIRNFEKNLSFNKYQLFKESEISYLDITTVLDEGELYIDFANIGSQYYIFTLDKRHKVIFQKISSDTIDNTIQAIRKEIKEENFELEKAEEKYGKLYQEIVELLDTKGKESLIVSPDGLISLIPFEAFYDLKGGHYLIEKMSVRYIPSGRELIQLHKKREVSTNQIFVLANPNFDASLKGIKSKVRGSLFRTLTPTFESLGGSKREAQKIKKYFPQAKILCSDKATESNLFKMVSPHTLHLSTHGFFLKDSSILNPMLKSGIVLSGANTSIKNREEEGIVTALELSGINLKGTELVVLSACETGVGKVETADGVIGLRRSFMYAGAKRIVMSLWSVNDDATAWLIGEFYHEMKKNRSYAQALHNAKKSFIKNNNKHPYFWSGFILSGL